MKYNETLEQVAPTTKMATGANFSELGISHSILDILRGLKLDTPTPIQHQTIPVALRGQDLIGIAQTGTGKTFAFGIPMLQKLALGKGQGLVVVPTRELALQVTENLKKLGYALGLRTATLIGGEGIQRQLFLLRKQPQVIIATPGRLIDHIKRRTVKLDQIKILVLDEADMMLDLGFAPQIEEILKQTPKEKQTMLFSATMPAKIAQLAGRHLKLPISIEVAPQGTTAENVEQEVFVVESLERFSYLEKIINEHIGSILVFVRTRHGVKEVTKKLSLHNHRVAEIHSNLSLGQRRAALDAFKSGRVRILIATDVAARGLDINGIELVINYNLPDASSDYVHRVGRTGRAGKVGKAISLATPDQFRDIRDIERLINKNLPIKEFAKLQRLQERSFSRPRRQFGGRRFSRPSNSSSSTPRSVKPFSRPKTNFSAAPSAKPFSREVGGGENKKPQSNHFFKKKPVNFKFNKEKKNDYSRNYSTYRDRS